jgi:hypothetical protein
MSGYQGQEREVAVRSPGRGLNPAAKPYTLFLQSGSGFECANFVES